MNLCRKNDFSPPGPKRFGEHFIHAAAEAGSIEQSYPEIESSRDQTKRVCP